MSANVTFTREARSALSQYSVVTMCSVTDVIAMPNLGVEETAKPRAGLGES